MDIQKEMRDTISKNIIFYRKKCGLTQAQLADKVGYTDKSISKWERGDSVPDVFVLKELANIFGIKVSALLDEDAAKSPRNFVYTKRKSILFLYAFVVVYAIAMLGYVTLSMIFPEENKLYLIFIYALPIATSVLLIMNQTWKVPVLSLILKSVILWSVVLSLFVSFHSFWLISKDYYLFFGAIPLQALFILWYFRHKKVLK